MAKRKYTYTPASKKTTRRTVRLADQYAHEKQLAADYLSCAVNSVNWKQLPYNRDRKIKSVKIGKDIEIFESNLDLEGKTYQQCEGIVRIHNKQVTRWLNKQVLQRNDVVMHTAAKLANSNYDNTAYEFEMAYMKMLDDDARARKIAAQARKDRQLFEKEMRKQLRSLPVIRDDVLDLRYRYNYSRKLNAPFAAEIDWTPALVQFCDYKLIMYNKGTRRVWTDSTQATMHRTIMCVLNSTAPYWYQRYRLVKTGKINPKFANGYPKRTAKFLREAGIKTQQQKKELDSDNALRENVVKYKNIDGVSI